MYSTKLDAKKYVFSICTDLCGYLVLTNYQYLFLSRRIIIYQFSCVEKINLLRFASKGAAGGSRRWRA